MEKKELKKEKNNKKEEIEKKNDDVVANNENLEKKEEEKEQIKNEIKESKSKTIGLASDHRGYKLKQKLTKYLEKIGYTVIDYGTNTTISSDYPVFAFKLGKAIINKEVEKGIAICGSGIGISIACNKVKGIRCAKVNNIKEVKQCRKDNDANIIAISGTMPLIRAKDVVDMFLKTTYEGEERHQRRIDMLDNYEE